MKKFAIIGTAVVALAGPLAQSALAMPADVTPVVQSQTVKPLPAVALEQGSGQRFAVQPSLGPTKAEQRADTLRGEALNRSTASALTRSAPRWPSSGRTPSAVRR